MRHSFACIIIGFCTFFLFAPATGQERYLVSPTDEVVRLNPGDDAQQVIRQQTRSSATQVCFDKALYGFDYWQANDYFGAKRGDVMGEWFVAKATGIIDTIIWVMGGDLPTDSMVYVRVHRSFIGPDYGPGIRPGPFNPPCQKWGYWVNTNNPDGGTTAFPEEATDTTWHSTIEGSPVPSTPPIGEVLWGTGGYPVPVHPWQYHYLPMDEFTGPIPVNAGDKFFISFEVRGQGTGWTRFGGVDYVASPPNEDYPSRLWKYYANGGEGSTCGMAFLDSVHRGWNARGGFSYQDSTNVAVIRLMYTMVYTSNAPPVVYGVVPEFSATFSTASQPVSAIIWDCNFATPPNAGVAGAGIRYSVNGIAQPLIPLTDAGADLFTGAIPGQPGGSSVTWQLVAWDIDGDTGRSDLRTYSVVPFGTEWYRIDTGYACTVRDISSSGTDIDTSAFFLPGFAGSGTEPKDDGTAGPIDMGSSFVLFGKPFRYAWIGVNGGLSLSESPTDTQDVNANGNWLPPDSTKPWTIPGPSKDGRGTPLTTGEIPSMYIAPMGADHVIGDSNGQYGRILYGDAGDTCLFIAQWDSIGGSHWDGPIADITTFRVILNRCTGLVEYQYESVGTIGLDSTGLMGMQIAPDLAGTTDPGYVTLNRLGYPIQTRPYDGSCVRFFPATGMVADDGWSLVSLPVAPSNGNYMTPVLFPELESRLYSYPYSDHAPDTVKRGTGYWVKSSVAKKLGRVPGALFHELAVPVRNGWNLIGGPSDIVSTGEIIPTGTSVSSVFYGYGESGYSSVTTLEPGDGYWVRVTGDGTLGMNAWGAAPAAHPDLVETPEAAGFNPVTFTDAKGRSQTLYLAGTDRIGKNADRYELPPAPPTGSFDVRFGSGKWVEPFPGEEGAARELPVSIRGAAYPVTMRWDLGNGAPRGSTLVLALPGKEEVTPMAGAGSLVLTDPGVNTVAIRTDNAGATPLSYWLGSNYPNPFNPSTLIRYSIAKPGAVSLKIFNALGEEVATLVNEEMPAGEHAAEWRPAGVASGIYFCRLSAGEFSDSRKLVLMK